MKKLFCFLAIVPIIISLPLQAHSGRTDSNGGHYDRKTGEYHYHNSGSSSSGQNQAQPYISPQPQPIPKKSKPVNYPREKELKETTLVEGISRPVKPVEILENHWQVALNNIFFHGRLEVSVSTGIVDILTDTMVVEVDKASKYQEGIEQALKYAQATGKKPVLALYIDGERSGYEDAKAAETLCEKKGVLFVLANNYISVNDFLKILEDAGLWGQTLAIQEAEDSKPDETKSNSGNSQSVKSNYWITNSSGVRHNSSCRFYQNSNGRPCSANEGRACKICGG